MQVGLALEGGAMRGMYTAGVLDVFLDEGIRADAAAGSSAGAIFGVNWLSGQRGRVIRYSKRFNADPRYTGLRSLLLTGNLVNTAFAYGTVPRELDPFDDAAFMRDGRPFWASVTDVHTGEAAYLRIGSVFGQMDALRASASMPFVSRPVAIGSRQYLDGGIAAPVPWEVLRRQGCIRQIAVLTREAGYVKKPVSPALIRLCYHRYPALAAPLRRQHEVYRETVRALEAATVRGEVFLIRPSEPITIARMEKDPAKLQRVYDLGVRDARACLDALKGFLAAPSGAVKGQ